MSSEQDLGNPSFLQKIDRLRATNVGTIIPLPQLVVVGDQSSGKSSVLESLTGFSFPRATGLCTRYATQITCARDGQRRVVISIIPRPLANEKLKVRLLGFRRELDTMDNGKLCKVFEDANEAMGIRMNTGDSDASSAAFSEDILKIEICGPDEIHLTVIDVPGIFRVPTPGLTSDADVGLVRNMVKRYMTDSRTIILAVIPATVDIYTQEILKMAEAVDPRGERTMGVLTKPDLLMEEATKDRLIELVRDNRELKLGYYIVKNRNADDTTSTIAQRLESETAFFSSERWLEVASRCGTARLKMRLRILLMNISRREFPNVLADIRYRISQYQKLMEELGERRSDEASQRQFLVKLAMRMQGISMRALKGQYSGEKKFQDYPGLKLITKIVSLSEDFASEFLLNGHAQSFDMPDADDDHSDKNAEEPIKHENEPIIRGKGGLHAAGHNITESRSDRSNMTTESGSFESDVDLFESTFSASGEAYQEITDIIADVDYECPEPRPGPMTETIRKVYVLNRGPELGTFSGETLAAMFEKVSEKWPRLAISHTSKAILLVHEFLRELLNICCVNETVRQQVWDNFLFEELCERYKAAIQHTHKLLLMERSSPPATCIHRFSRLLQIQRRKRSDNQHEPQDRSNSTQIYEDILDTLHSYYTIARERFLDTLYQQVIYDLLLGGSDSPLFVFNADRILQLNPSQLDAIAGEDMLTRSRRASLQRKINSLKEAIQVLKS